MGVKDSPRTRPRRTGSAPPGSTGRRTPGRGGGPRPTSSSPPARSAPGCASMGVGFFPVVGWAERGGYTATGPRQLGSALPHHVGHRARRRSSRSCAGSRAASSAGLVTLRFRHRVDELIVEGGAVSGVRGAVLAPDARRTRRGEQPGGRRRLRDPRAGATIVASGGIGGNHDLVREQWPTRLGTAARAHAHRRARPRRRPDARHHRAGRRAARSTATGCGTTSRASRTTTPVWARHGIRILPGPSSVWLDATGKRLPVPLFPGFDTLGTLEHILADRPRPQLVRAHPEDHREGVRPLRQRAEPRPDRQGHASCCCSGVRKGAPGPVEAFKEKGADFVVADTLDELIAGMQRLSPDVDARRRSACGRDRGPRPRARQRLREGCPDRRAAPARALSRRQADPGGEAAPHPRPEGRSAHRGQAAHPHPQEPRRHRDRPGRPGARRRRASRFPGCTRRARPADSAAAAMHGYRSLEGTFLGGCLFSGRVAGRAIAAQV